MEKPEEYQDLMIIHPWHSQITRPLSVEVSVPSVVNFVIRGCFHLQESVLMSRHIIFSSLQSTPISFQFGGASLLCLLARGPPKKGYRNHFD